MDLKPLTLEDLPIFEKFYKMSEYEGYNSNFITMFMWNHEYNVHYYANEHFLVALCHYEHLMFWNMPLTTKEYFKEAIDFMRRYSREHELPFYIDGVLNEQCEWLEALYPDEFIMVKQPGEYDYIYDRKMLETLSGKKMQKRRNHYNTFIRMYGDKYVYRSVENSDDQAIANLIHQWAMSKDDDPNILIESTGIINLLKHFKDLPIKAGCIEINGKIEALIIGSMLNHETLQIHVEKANTAFRGLYVAILKHFLENEFKQAKWVNREDDLNIPSMRQAKMNLHPVKLLEKSFVFPNQIVYRPSTWEDYSQLISAWKNNFTEDSDAYIHEYFHTYYRPENTWVCTVDNMIVSVAHLRPIKISNRSRIEEGRYIEGVSTHFMFRKLGFIKELLTRAIEQTSCDYFFLQAYNWDIYRFLDFGDYTSKKKILFSEPFNVKKVALDDSIDPQHCLNLYEQTMASKNGYPVRDKEDYLHIQKLVALNEQHMLLFEDAYIIYEIMKGKCVVLETIGKTEDDIKSLLNILIYQYGSIIVLAELDCFLDYQGEVILFLQAKEKNKMVPEGHLYFNEYI